MNGITLPAPGDGATLLAGSPRRQTVEATGRTPRDPMPSVCCYLGTDLARRFLVRVPQAIAVDSQSALLDAVRREAVSLVVADPDASHSDCTETLIKIRSELPAVLVAVYTALRPSVVSHIVRLAHHGIQDVVISGTDDSKSRFDELIERSTSASLTLGVMHVLSGHLRRVPDGLAAAVGEMFESPRRIRSVAQLAAAGAMTRRSLYRHLSAAGIESPRLLVASARVVRAAHMLAGSDLSVSEVSRSLGFSKPEAMTEQIKSVLGLRPRDLRDGERQLSVPTMIAARLGLTEGNGGGDDPTTALSLSSVESV